MTDKEMAREIGESVLTLLHENAVLKGILRSMKQTDGNPVPWQQMLETDKPLLESSHVASEQFEWLQQQVHAHTNAAGLLETLHELTVRFLART